MIVFQIRTRSATLNASLTLFTSYFMGFNMRLKFPKLSRSTEKTVQSNPRRFVLRSSALNPAQMKHSHKRMQMTHQ